MRLTPAVMFAVSMSWIASAQTYTISTFAGGGLPVNITGTSASLYGPRAVAVDKTGNVFFADGQTILRLDATTGVLSLAAGNGTPGYSGDNGPATSAQLNIPYGVAVDSANNLLIADYENGRIRKVSNGVITTVAGGGSSLGDNGPATSAQLSPYGVAVDSANNLFIADTYNGRIRKVSNGVITTVAGNGTQGFSGDNGPATSAQLNYPQGVVVDSASNLYIADTYNGRIRKISNGVITTVAGNGTIGYSGDNGPATSAQLFPFGVAIDSASNLYIADYGNSRIRKVSNGVITTVAGGGSSLGDGGPATSAQLFSPAAVAVDSASNLYIADTYNGRIRKISNGVITTVAGNGTHGYSGDNGPATGAQLNNPYGVAVDSANNLYIADYGNSRIRKVSNGVITTVAGNGTPDYSGDNGPATSAELDYPYGVAVDSANNLYIADYLDSRIRKVSNGVITTVAGNGTPGYSGDNGPATSAQLSGPYGVAVDSANNLYIADTQNDRIRKVSNGVITTVAGNGTPGYSGDNGPATSAQLNSPQGVAVDSTGSLYITDSNNSRVRKVSNGVITTVAGNGTQGFSGDNGPATSAQLGSPQGVAADSAGNLYIADGGTVYIAGGGNRRIRKVSNGVITTIAGGGSSYGDGGPATSAQLDGFLSVALDATGKVYVGSNSDNRIRLLTPSASSCTYAATPTALQASVLGGNLAVSIQTAAGCSWTISGLPSWITTSTPSGSGPATVTLVVAANTSGAALSATISVAGTFVTITQPAAVSSGCTYAINPGGQAFTSAGGSGTTSVAAGANCAWSANSNVSWVTITGASSGTGNGTVTFQAAVNGGVAQTGTITVAGLPFTVEEGAASGVSLSNAGSMAQIASAGFWTTTITLVNTGATTAQARLNFFGDNGGPVTLPWTSPQLANSSGPTLASTLDRTLNPGAEVVLQTTGPANLLVTEGWMQLLTNGRISGYAIFSDGAGSTAQDAISPLENRNASGYVVSFDNTNGNVTGIAVANLTAQALNTTVNISDDTGAAILSTTLALPAMGHTSFVMTAEYGSVVAQKRGTMTFTTPSAGQISVIGIKANSTGGLSDIPPLLQ